MKHQKNSDITLVERRIRSIIREEIRKFRTYGIGDFDSAKFDKPTNWTKYRMARNKPFGGLWGTPTDEGSFGWTQWNERERFLAYDDDDYFEFVFKPNAKIYVIKTKEDIARLPQQWDSQAMRGKVDTLNYSVAMQYGCEFYPDFERISQKYDAIEYHHNADTGSCLYGWDCDCVLVLNPDAIEIVKHNTQERKGHEYHEKLAAKKYGREDEFDEMWDME